MDAKDTVGAELSRSRRTLLRAVRAMRALLPRGDSLSDEVWTRRHRGILLLLWAHAVGLAIFAIARGYGIGHSLQEGGVVAVFATVAGLPWRRRTFRATVATTGVFASSAILVHISGGTIEAHFHFFVMVGVVALYQDWTAFLVAIGFVLLHHGVMGVLDPPSVYNHRAALIGPWKWAGVHALFIAGASAVSLYSWRLSEKATAMVEESYRRLYEGEHALVQRLEDARRMKDDLVAMVSHEFRTPVTAILGLGQTLIDKGDVLTAEERTEFVTRSVAQAQRLRRIVENLLQAAQVVEPQLAGSSDLGEVTEAAIDELADLPERRAVGTETALSPGLRVRMGPDVLHMVVANLVGNALKFATAGTRVEVASRLGGGSTPVQLRVSNAAPDLSAEDIERIFQPFVQLDSSRTRSVAGVGLGLHIVRRLVEGHGGTVEAQSAGGRVTFTVSLPGGEQAAEERSARGRFAARAAIPAA